MNFRFKILRQAVLSPLTGRMLCCLDALQLASNALDQSAVAPQVDRSCILGDAGPTSSSEIHGSNSPGLAAKARFACGGKAERFSPKRMARAWRMPEGAFPKGFLFPPLGCRSSAPAAARAGLRSARQARSKQRADPRRSTTPPRQQWLAASRCMCSLQRTAQGPTVPVTTTAAFQVFRHTPLQAPCNEPQQSPLSCQADTGSASSRAGRPLGPLAVPSQRPPGAHMSKHRITYILSMAFDGPSRRSRATKKLSLALTLVSQKLVPERIISSTPEALAGLEARIVWRLSSAWPSGTPAQAARAAQACTARSTI